METTTAAVPPAKKLAMRKGPPLKGGVPLMKGKSLMKAPIKAPGGKLPLKALAKFPKKGGPPLKAAVPPPTNTADADDTTPSVHRSVPSGPPPRLSDDELDKIVSTEPEAAAAEAPSDEKQPQQDNQKSLVQGEEGQGEKIVMAAAPETHQIPPPVDETPSTPQDTPVTVNTPDGLSEDKLGATSVMEEMSPKQETTPPSDDAVKAEPSHTSDAPLVSESPHEVVTGALPTVGDTAAKPIEAESSAGEQQTSPDPAPIDGSETPPTTEPTQEQPPDIDVIHTLSTPSPGGDNSTSLDAVVPEGVTLTEEESPTTDSVPATTEMMPPGTESVPPTTEMVPPGSEIVPPTTEMAPPTIETELPVAETGSTVTETVPQTTETDLGVINKETTRTETVPQATETEKPVEDTEGMVKETVLPDMPETVGEAESPALETQSPVTETMLETVSPVTETVVETESVVAETMRAPESEPMTETTPVTEPEAEPETATVPLVADSGSLMIETAPGVDQGMAETATESMRLIEEGVASEADRGDAARDEVMLEAPDVATQPVVPIPEEALMIASECETTTEMRETEQQRAIEDFESMATVEEASPRPRYAIPSLVETASITGASISPMPSGRTAVKVLARHDVSEGSSLEYSSPLPTIRDTAISTPDQPSMDEGTPRPPDFTQSTSSALAVTESLTSPTRSAEHVAEANIPEAVVEEEEEDHDHSSSSASSSATSVITDIIVEAVNEDEMMGTDGTGAAVLDDEERRMTSSEYVVSDSLAAGNSMNELQMYPEETTVIVSPLTPQTVVVDGIISTEGYNGTVTPQYEDTATENSGEVVYSTSIAAAAAARAAEESEEYSGGSPSPTPSLPIEEDEGRYHDENSKGDVRTDEQQLTGLQILSLLRAKVPSLTPRETTTDEEIEDDEVLLHQNHRVEDSHYHSSSVSHHQQHHHPETTTSSTVIDDDVRGHRGCDSMERRRETTETEIDNLIAVVIGLESERDVEVGPHFPETSTHVISASHERQQSLNPVATVSQMQIINPAALEITLEAQQAQEDEHAMAQATALPPPDDDDTTDPQPMPSVTHPSHQTWQQNEAARHFSHDVAQVQAVIESQVGDEGEERDQEREQEREQEKLAALPPPAHTTGAEQSEGGEGIMTTEEDDDSTTTEEEEEDSEDDFEVAQITSVPEHPSPLPIPTYAGGAAGSLVYPSREEWKKGEEHNVADEPIVHRIVFPNNDDNIPPPTSYTVPIGTALPVIGSAIPPSETVAAGPTWSLVSEVPVNNNNNNSAWASQQMDPWRGSIERQTGAFWNDQNASSVQTHQGVDELLLSGGALMSEQQHTSWTTNSTGLLATHHQSEELQTADDIAQPSTNWNTFRPTDDVEKPLSAHTTTWSNIHPAHLEIGAVTHHYQPQSVAWRPHYPPQQSQLTISQSHADNAAVQTGSSWATFRPHQDPVTDTTAAPVGESLGTSSRPLSYPNAESSTSMTAVFESQGAPTWNTSFRPQYHTEEYYTSPHPALTAPPAASSHWNSPLPSSSHQQPQPQPQQEAPQETSSSLVGAAQESNLLDSNSWTSASYSGDLMMSSRPVSSAVWTGLAAPPTATIAPLVTYLTPNNQHHAQTDFYNRDEEDSTSSSSSTTETSSAPSTTRIPMTTTHWSPLPPKQTYTSVIRQPPPPPPSSSTYTPSTINTFVIPPLTSHNHHVQYQHQQQQYSSPSRYVNESSVAAAPTLLPSPQTQYIQSPYRTVIPTLPPITAASAAAVPTTTVTLQTPSSASQQQQGVPSSARYNEEECTTSSSSSGSASYAEPAASPPPGPVAPSGLLALPAPPSPSPPALSHTPSPSLPPPAASTATSSPQSHFSSPSAPPPPRTPLLALPAPPSPKPVTTTTTTTTTTTSQPAQQEYPGAVLSSPYVQTANVEMGRVTVAAPVVVVAGGSSHQWNGGGTGVATSASVAMPSSTLSAVTVMPTTTTIKTTTAGEQQTVMPISTTTVGEHQAAAAATTTTTTNTISTTYSVKPSPLAAAVAAAIKKSKEEAKAAEEVKVKQRGSAVVRRSRSHHKQHSQSRSQPHTAREQSEVILQHMPRSARRESNVWQCDRRSKQCTENVRAFFEERGKTNRWSCEC